MDNNEKWFVKEVTPRQRTFTVVLDIVLKTEMMDSQSKDAWLFALTGMLFGKHSAATGSEN